MAAYWIAHVHVTDAEAYARYVDIASRAFEEFGGEFLARGGHYRQFEGRERERHVIVRFTDFESAEACYNSQTYQDALSHARDAAERELVIVEGD